MFGESVTTKLLDDSLQMTVANQIVYRYNCNCNRRKTFTNVFILFRSWKHVQIRIKCDTRLPPLTPPPSFRRQNNQQVLIDGPSTRTRRSYYKD